MSLEKEDKEEEDQDAISAFSNYFHIDNNNFLNVFFGNKDKRLTLIKRLVNFAFITVTWSKF